jgi:HlyD family secretion protein
MKKKLLILLGAVVVIILVVANLGLGRGGVDVTAEDVERGTVVASVSASGKVYPVTEVKVSSLVSARIARLVVHEGEEVARGALLVELDRTLYQARVEGAQAALRSQAANAEAAEASLRQAEDALKEQQALAERGMGADKLLRDARNNFDAAQARVRSAQAQVASAQAQLEQSQDDLSRTRILAPMAGTVTALTVEEGEMVLGTQMALGTVMMAVSDLSRMEVQVDVDETDVVQVVVGQVAEVEVDAFPGRILKGTVTEIANSGTTLGRGTQMEVTNFAVKIELETSQVQLRPGMSAAVDIITETHEGVLRVPIQAVTARKLDDIKELPAVSNFLETSPPEAERAAGQKEQERWLEVVYVVTEEGTAQLRCVRTGISSTTTIEILEGLAEGEKVVTGPFRVLSRTLKDGERVNVKETLLEDAGSADGR